ncbi:MAG: aldo/keto reductase [Woeseia sp.]|nr:aldo/keto reductase [Woeseia sp.]NNE60933.1 aldo/keto reductase [Woeseia sp.]NNL56053.1 aldo/keto reductase [Woeseia sp.]
MKISRRHFTKLTIGGSLALAFGQGARASDDVLGQKGIPSSVEKIPIVGLGTNRYGVGDNQEQRAMLREALATFHKLGGTVIDTAPMYRSSEQVLGDLIEELGIRDALFMATKVDVNGRQEQAARMQRSFDRLKYDEIDLMQNHNLIDWQNAIPAMREWQEEGRVRYVGITSSRESQYEEMERIMKNHDLDFIQINYSLADQRRSDQRLLPLAADRGMAVLVNRPFGGGRVFRKLGGAEIPEWAQDFGAESWAQFLLKYALSHPAATAAIPGMTKKHHVEDNMQAARGRLPTPAERKRQETFFDSL